MPLSAGARLGPYEILGPIGKGGMGEVYRAKDTKLKREVAVKVLPEAFAKDRERMARFQREAEVLASLNHPNIAQIYASVVTSNPAKRGHRKTGQWRTRQDNSSYSPNRPRASRSPGYGFRPSTGTAAAVLVRQLLGPHCRTWPWCSSRSSIELTAAVSPSNFPQSSMGRFDVNSVLARS